MLRNYFTIGKLAYKTFLPIIISHHPMCINYSSHFVLVGPLKICKGCLTSWIPFFIAQVVFLPFLVLNYFSIPKLNYSSFVYPSLACTFILLLTNEYFETKITLILKTGFFFVNGFLFICLFDTGNYLTIMVIYLIINGYLLINLTKRRKKMENICKKCNEYKNFGKCSGLYMFNEFMIELDLIKN